MELSNVSIRGCELGGGVPEQLIAALLHLHAAGRFPFERMIRRYRFDEINQAIEDTASGKVVKPVLMMPQST
jgi:aryl-alcohol dehydrogenase